MIKNNENKKVSRNRKKRTEQKNKMGDTMKILSNKIKSEKEKKNKNIDKSKEFESELVKTKYVNNHNELQSAMKDLNKIQVVVKTLQEIKQVILQNYDVGNEMVGRLKIGDQIRQSHIRFRKITDCEAHINSIDKRYDAKDDIFNGYIFLKSIHLILT